MEVFHLWSEVIITWQILDPIECRDHSDHMSSNHNWDEAKVFTLLPSEQVYNITLLEFVCFVLEINQINWQIKHFMKTNYLN